LIADCLPLVAIAWSHRRRHLWEIGLSEAAVASDPGCLCRVFPYEVSERQDVRGFRASAYNQTSFPSAAHELPHASVVDIDLCQRRKHTEMIMIMMTLAG